MYRLEMMAQDTCLQVPSLEFTDYHWNVAADTSHAGNQLILDTYQTISKRIADYMQLSLSLPSLLPLSLSLLQ